MSLFSSLPPGVGKISFICLVCSLHVLFIEMHYGVRFPIWSEWGCWGDFWGPAVLYCISIQLKFYLLKYTLLLYRLFCIVCPHNILNNMTQYKDILAAFRLRQSDQKSAETADGHIILIIFFKGCFICSLECATRIIIIMWKRTKQKT